MSRCRCGADESVHHEPSIVTSGCVVSPSFGHRCPCLRFTPEDKPEVSRRPRAGEKRGQ